MKKTILMLLLALALLTAAALGEAQERVFEVTDVALQHSGSVRIEWTDSAGAGPYRVLFQPCTYFNKDAPDGTRTVWCNSGEVDGTYYYEQCMMPYSDYWIIILDANNAQATYLYEGSSSMSRTYLMPMPGFHVTITPHEIRYIGNNESNEVDALVREDILNADIDTGYGFVVHVACDDSDYNDRTLRLFVNDMRNGPELVAMVDYPLAEIAHGVTFRVDMTDWLKDFIARSKTYDTFSLSLYMNDEFLFGNPLISLK